MTILARDFFNMSETIYGFFKTAIQAQAAEAEISEMGVRDSDIIVNDDDLRITVHAKVEIAVEVRSTIERHGGRVQVDDIPDPGTIPGDPLEFSE